MNIPYGSARPNQASSAAAVVIGMTLAAILFGLVAVTAHPVIVGVAAAALVGVALLARPIWMLWLIFVLGLLIAGIVPIWAEGVAAKAVWGIAVLGFAAMGIAFFRAVTARESTKDTPAFVWVALVFFLYVIINGLFHFDNAYVFFSGFKRYFQAMGLIFALAWLAVDERTVTRWLKFFVLVAIVQLPWAMYELIKLVPIREGLSYSYNLVPIDVVAGTFGANMTSGGANAEMATFLIVVMIFLLTRLRERDLPMGRLLWLLPAILAPLFMGETKAVVILLPLAFLTLYRGELLARPHIAIAGILVGALLTVVAGFSYLSLTKKSLDQQVSDTLRYNVYEKGYGGYALNRTTVLTFWADRQGLHDPAGVVFGHGLGSAHDQTAGHVAQRYPGYGIGLTAASTLLWEQGLVGTSLFFAMLAFAWRAAGRLIRSAAEGWVRADVVALQTTLPLFAFYLIYRSSLLESMPFQVVFYALLGYLAWQARREKLRNS